MDGTGVPVVKKETAGRQKNKIYINKSKHLHRRVTLEGVWIKKKPTNQQLLFFREI